MPPLRHLMHRLTAPALLESQLGPSAAVVGKCCILHVALAAVVISSGGCSWNKSVPHVGCCTQRLHQVYEVVKLQVRVQNSGETLQPHIQGVQKLHWLSRFWGWTYLAVTLAVAALKRETNFRMPAGDLFAQIVRRDGTTGVGQHIKPGQLISCPCHPAACLLLVALIGRNRRSAPWLLKVRRCVQARTARTRARRRRSWGSGKRTCSCCASSGCPRCVAHCCFPGHWMSALSHRGVAGDQGEHVQVCQQIPPQEGRKSLPHPKGARPLLPHACRSSQQCPCPGIAQSSGITPAINIRQPCHRPEAGCSAADSQCSLQC